MSAATNLPSEDHFLCSICLDVFTDPVTIPCGHNFCKNCIDEHWNQSTIFKCPICNETFENKLQFKVNTFISETVSQFRRESQQKSSCSSEQQAAKPGEVLCDICTGTKLKALRSCLVCLISCCETHLEPHLTVKGLKRHQLMEPVENLEGRICMKHDKPLELFCKTDQTCVCMHCSYLHHKTHDVVSLSEGKKAELGKTGAEMQQMIQKRRLKIEEIKESVKKSKDAADREKAEGVQVFTALKESERRLNGLIKEIEDKQKTIEKQAEDSIKDLEQEISELMKRNSEMEQLLKSEDHFHLLQSFSALKAAPPTKDWTEVGVCPPSYEGTVLKAVAQLEETIRKWMKKKLMEAELKRVQQYAVDVTLDPNTANKWLILSEDGKQVKHGNERKKLPDNPERFCYYIMVLGNQSFSSGRFYFEVQVKGKTDWDLGVVRESINRKGGLKLSPQDGYWIVVLRNGNEYAACENPPVRLHLQSGPEKVGVFVDYEEGLVSFYDVDAAALIYSFTGCFFNHKLLPFFCPGWNDGDKNSAPLVITPISQSSSVMSATDVQSEDHFLCSICLDVFTDPVTMPCGHNFCKNCVDEHWNQSISKCPNCNETVKNELQLKINTLIHEMASQSRRESQQKSSSSSEQQAAKPGEVLCDICTGIKLKALKSCLVCLISYCETHLEPHLTMKGLKTHQLMDTVENLEGRICMKHNKPLELFSKTDQTCICMHCFYSHHKTCDVLPLREECEEKKAELVKTEAEMQQMIQKRRLKIEEIKESVKKSEAAADREEAEGVQVFTALMKSVERCLDELIVEMEDKQKTTGKWAEDSIKDLEQEISELMKRSSEVEQLLKSEDHLHLLQSFSSLKAAPPTKDWTEVGVCPPYEGTVVRAVAQLEETIRKWMKKKLMEAELKRVQQYAVDVTLDPGTAHPDLILSDDGKEVHDSDVGKKLPDNPERFSICVVVLGNQRFSSGRFYFEVQVKGKTDWDLGVARESINRKGGIKLSPQDGYWTIVLRNGNEYEAAEFPSVRLNLQSGPEKVGVFVDYEGGLVSFYDVDAAALIYSFTGCAFNHKLLPYFCPCDNDGGKNSAPLLITPILQLVEN
ncbi:uncharacterized protein KZ484_001583 [Pholidichthys leucotaenia]